MRFRLPRMPRCNIRIRPTILPARDLYTTGLFIVRRYGLGWRPFGVGPGWSPFSAGQWMWDPSFGWTWMSSSRGVGLRIYGGWLFECRLRRLVLFATGVYGSPYVPRKAFPAGFILRARSTSRRRESSFAQRKSGYRAIHPLDEKARLPESGTRGFLSALSKGMSERITGGEFGQKWGRP